ncbi:aspartyl/asparaginyl beta-hydroxylase domain-containing protein [Spirillospora sp. NPDC047279]|uniref:aspartyl/asparaginyl beta-hydroxylase domain-containing protein n=1 Tax=Spirillospora sp. NPDC047279 TaxID=3155478 RepID=UPI0033CF7C30
MTTHDSPEAVKLRSGYDVERLVQDLANVSRASWAAKTRYSSTAGGPGAPRSSNGWSCLPLRSPGGRPSRTDPGGPGVLDFAYTPAFERVPYVQEILSGLPGNHRQVSLLELAPGGSTHVHRDHPSGFAFGWIRLHIPITTNDRCFITIDGKRHHWRPGELWYGDFSRLHHVTNDGTLARVHLVVDIEVSPQVTEIFPPGFLARLGKDRILHNRPEVPLPDCPDLTHVFKIPVGEHLFADEPWRASADDRCVVTVSAGEHGRLNLSTTDGLEATLIHTGEHTFRYAGWTDAHTLTIDAAAGRAPVVTWRFREGAATVAETTIVGQRPCLPAMTTTVQ